MDVEIKERWVALLLWIEQEDLRQGELAKLAGVSQAAVSRVLAGKPAREGRAFKKLCNYAIERQTESPNRPLNTSPIVDHTLASAIWEVWNGTPEHARAIAAVIRAAGAVATVGSRGK